MCSVQIIFANSQSEKHPEDEYKDTPLDYAAKSCQKEVFHLLMKTIKDKNRMVKIGNTLFCKAAEDGNLAMIEMIVEAMEEICPQTVDGQNSVKLALKMKNNYYETALSNAEYNKSVYENIRGEDTFERYANYDTIVEYIKDLLDEDVENQKAKKQKLDEDSEEESEEGSDEGSEDF